jgi:putative spermidine/putrescine transport system substrate-binding protein
MTLVSWGGAYQASQINAYAEPYKAMHPGVEVIWDESSAEAVAKLRAMNEAGNITWDWSTWLPRRHPPVRRRPGDGISIHDEMLARRRWHAGLRGLRRPDRVRLLHPADRLFDHLRLPHRRGSGTAHRRPTSARVRPGKFPGKRALERRPINNMEWALLCDGVAKEDVYDVLETEEGRTARLPSSTPSRTRLSGGPPAPKRRSFSPTAKSSWARPTMVVCSA